MVLIMMALFGKRERELIKKGMFGLGFNRGGWHGMMDGW